MDEHADIPKIVKKLLNVHKSLEILPEQQKIKCRLTGHEMPCRSEAIEAYINGKKYKRLTVAGSEIPEQVNYREYLVPSNKKGHERQLFCKITYRHVNNLPHHIAQHFSGKRFQQAYKRYELCKETGEVFKANLGRTKPRVDPDSGPREKRKKHLKEGEEEEEDDDDDDDKDSMSDLLPLDYFEELNIKETDSDEHEVDEPMKVLNGDVVKHKSNHKDKTNSAADVSPKKLKRKLDQKKKPAVLKTVKAKKFKTAM